MFNDGKCVFNYSPAQRMQFILFLRNSLLIRYRSVKNLILFVCNELFLHYTFFPPVVKAKYVQSYNEVVKSNPFALTISFPFSFVVSVIFSAILTHRKLFPHETVSSFTFFNLYEANKGRNVVASLTITHCEQFVIYFAPAYVSEWRTCVLVLCCALGVNVQKKRKNHYVQTLFASQHTWNSLRWNWIFF